MQQLAEQARELGVSIDLKRYTFAQPPKSKVTVRKP